MKIPAIKNYIDTRLILLLGGFYALFDVVYVVKYAYMRNYYVREQFEPWYDFLLYNVLLDWMTVVTYMSLIAISTKRFLYKNYSWVKIICIHTVFSILIGLIIRLIFDFIGIITEQFTWDEYQFSHSLHRFMAVVDLNFLIYFAMVFIIYTYYYVKQVKEAENHRRLLETQLVNTRMKMLSAQLQPHFLFNTLNSIAVLADLDASKAKDTIADLSDFLREILYSSETSEITLEKELQTLDYYLNILNVRFSDHLKVTKSVDEKLLSSKVPALLFQPLIENSIKHGYSYEHTNLEINISAQQEGKYLVLKVMNNGEKVIDKHAQLLKKGVGLSNLNDRLENLYGNNYFFEIRKRRDAEGVETVVKLPKQ